MRNGWKWNRFIYCFTNKVTATRNKYPSFGWQVWVMMMDCFAAMVVGGQVWAGWEFCIAVKFTLMYDKERLYAKLIYIYIYFFKENVHPDYQSVQHLPYMDCVVKESLRLHVIAAVYVLTFLRGMHWCPVNTHHKGPVTRRFDVLLFVAWSNC